MAKVISRMASFSLSFPYLPHPLPHFYPPKSKNDVILAYLILILRKNSFEEIIKSRTLKGIEQ
jgi:hypothetical protein